MTVWLADRTERGMIGYWHSYLRHTVIYLIFHTVVPFVRLWRCALWRIMV